MVQENGSTWTLGRIGSAEAIAQLDEGTAVLVGNGGPLTVINPLDPAAWSTGKRRRFVLDEISAMRSEPLYRVTFEAVLRQSIASGRVGRGWGKSVAARPLGRPATQIAFRERGGSR